MRQQKKVDSWVDIASDPLTRYHACKAMARGYAEARKTDRVRVQQARAFCAHAIESFWKALCERHGTSIKIKPLSLSVPIVALDARRVAEDAGRLVASFPVEDAGYLIGSIYTVMLPASLRSSLGAYYTPPSRVAPARSG